MLLILGEINVTIIDSENFDTKKTPIIYELVFIRYYKYNLNMFYNICIESFEKYTYII